MSSQAEGRRRGESDRPRDWRWVCGCVPRRTRDRSRRASCRWCAQRPGHLAKRRCAISRSQSLMDCYGSVTGGLLLRLCTYEHCCQHATTAAAFGFTSAICSCQESAGAGCLRARQAVRLGDRARGDRSDGRAGRASRAGRRQWSRQVDADEDRVRSSPSIDGYGEDLWGPFRHPGGPPDARLPC